MEAFRSIAQQFGSLFCYRDKDRRSAPPGRRLRLEALEPRQLLAAAGLVPVGAQPEGTLAGKIVYTRAGHGWNYYSNLGRWGTDRGNVNSIVEDFGNQDLETMYADYLLRAGATVVPLRPVGRQVNEVVLDNDSPGVTFTGTWGSNTAGARWYDEDYGAGGVDAVKYRTASPNAASETAVATYTPNIPQAGFYPVYVWTSHGGDRTNQLYKINHTGGQTQISVDHRMVGNGWVYLGTYHFNAGSSAVEGSVQISNYSTGGGRTSLVVADAVRFGNGMGDLPWGSGGIGTGSVSGYPREDEGSLPWVWRGLGQGVTPSSILGTSNVTASTRMAAHMTPSSNPFGSSLLISFHSNAGGGRGTEGLIHSTESSRTPNQQALATMFAQQIELDLIARNGQFPYNWATRRDYAAGAYGEINDTWINGKFDATIIEVGFHDSVMDSSFMRDPRGRDQMARSAYEGTLEYFINFGNVKPANVTLPSAPINVAAVSNAAGEVTLSWNAGPSSSGVGGVYGNPAAGFRIYASTDGYGFDGGTYVAGGVTSATLSGYDPSLPYYFKVVAENAGGQSLASEVLTVLPRGGQKQILIVNGFDRYDESQDFLYPYAYGGTTTARVWARYNNSFDYVNKVHAAIHAARPGVNVASASNERIINGSINLNDYDAVIWILGNESTGTSTFNAAEQSRVEQFIAAGGHLFVTGSEIAFDLDQSNNGRSFYENTLKGNYVADAANTYSVSSAAGGIFAGLSLFQFSNGAAFSNLDSQTYNVRSADVIAPQAGGQVALQYSGGTGGGAGIQVPGVDGRGNVVMFGFPFETITNASVRAAVMDRVLGYFGVSAVVPPNADFNDDGLVDGADFLSWQRNFGATVPPLTDGDANGDGAVDADDLTIWSEQFGESLPAVALSLSASSSSSSAAASSAALDAALTEVADEPILRIGAAALALQQAAQVDDLDRPIPSADRAAIFNDSQVNRAQAPESPPTKRLAPSAVNANLASPDSPEPQSFPSLNAARLPSLLKPPTN